MQMRRARAVARAAIAALTIAACSTDPTPSAESAAVAQPQPTATEPVAGTVDVPEPTAAPTSRPPTTEQPTTEQPTTTAAPTTTEQPTTTPAPTTSEQPTTTEAPNIEAEVIETRVVGQSVGGRPITAERRGTEGGRVVLVIGVIHGDENDGLAIMDELRRMPVPDGVDLWLVDSMNPDGIANDDRHNANGVDLNRNFPLNWGPIGAPGDGQYAGPSVASEPETQAMVAFISEIRPDLALWYHQDLYRISPGRGRDGQIRERYAELTGLPLVSITGGTYTGVAATWARNTLDPGVAFIVELGDSLTDAEAELHARAVLTVADEDN